MKYSDEHICLQEVPDEISICVSIMGCPLHCIGCHSPWLWDTSEEEGRNLNEGEVLRLVRRHPGATCFCFLGGDWNTRRLQELIYWLKRNTNLKVALYSGRDLDTFVKEDSSINLSTIDYLKVGRYVEALGGLDSKVTNQRMYKLKDGQIIGELTPVFQSR